MESQPNQTPTRNLQLDFFRGIALMIIFINHMPFNPLFDYTPSRFGLSDASETFVFLSGFAAALAYGRGFEQSGVGRGTLRILHRCARIYAAHLALFFVLAALCVVGNRWISGIDYIQRLNLGYFFDRTQEALFGLITLRYVPMYLDILPMYLLVMLWIPIIWALARFHFAWALGLSALIYLGANLFGWDLPADPLSERVWFFNPFAWQFMFFTGFALGAGWLRIPHGSRCLIALALLVVVVSVPFGHEPTFRRFGWLLEWRLSHDVLVDKTHLGILRWVHFLALAYLMNQLFRWKAHWLNRAMPRWIATVGRQSLPMFLSGAFLSYLGGMVLDWTGRGAFSAASVNLAGLGLMLLAAAGLSWLDSKPWKPVEANISLREAITGHFQTVEKRLLGVFTKPAVQLPLLVALGTAPFLLLQADREAKLNAPTVTAGLSNGNEDLRSNAVARQPEQEERIEWQDGL